MQERKNSYQSQVLETTDQKNTLIVMISPLVSAAGMTLPQASEAADTTST